MNERDQGANAPFIPWFEDFEVGDEYSEVPTVTVTSGMTAMHQGVFADRSRLFLDLPLSEAVTGQDRLPVNPSLVCNIAIGQSTIPSQRVMGNLFYRGLRMRAPVYVNDSLTTTTKVVGLRQNSPKPGRAASGMVALEINCENQHGDTVLHFWRCPMIPCRDPQVDTGRRDDFGMMPAEMSEAEVEASVPDWNLAPMAERVRPRDYGAGETIVLEAKDTVTAAPEMVRMTLNMAMTHTDLSASVYPRRLVYGGHTIALAASQLSRMMPDLACILAWYRCDHLAPVFEEDILGSEVTVTDVRAFGAGRIARLNIKVAAHRGEQHDEQVQVLDWDLAALLV